MKRLLSCILVLVMVFALAGCGKTAQSDTPSQSGANQPGSSQPSSSQPSSGQSGTQAPAATAKPDDTVPEASGGVQKQIVDRATGEFVRYITPSDGTAKRIDPDVFYIGVSGAIENGNPVKGSDNPFYDLCYDRLIRVDPDTGEYVGDILKSFEMSADNTVFTFEMNSGIKFHNGKPATVKDIFFTLKRDLDPTLAPQADRNTWGNVDWDKSEIIDDLHGKLVLKTPAITFIPAMIKTWLLSEDYINEVGEDNAFWANCIGTGPYKVKSLDQTGVVLTRVDDYWGDKGPDNSFFHKVKEVNIKGYSEGSTMYMDFETGHLDMITPVNVQDDERIIGGQIKNTISDIYPQMNTYSLVFNEEMGNPALNDINVRKAIALSVDAASVADMGWSFHGKRAISILPAGLPETVNAGYEQDIEEAKKALKEAGYKPGELTLSIGTQNGKAQSDAAEALQACISECGINIELIIVDATANIMNMRNGGNDTYDMGITMQICNTLESVNILGSISRGCGSASFSCPTDEKFDEICLNARAAKTVEEKRGYMRDMQQYLHDNYWLIPFCEANQCIAYREYVKGLKVYDPGMPDMMTVYFDD